MRRERDSIEVDVPASEVLAALDAFIHGDRTIDEYELFRAIDSGLRRHDPAYYGRALEWHSLTLARWHDQFRYGAPLQPLSPRDSAARLSLLLASDLTPLAGPAAPSLRQTLHHLHTNLIYSNI